MRKLANSSTSQFIGFLFSVWFQTDLSQTQYFPSTSGTSEVPVIFSSWIRVPVSICAHSRKPFYTATGKGLKAVTLYVCPQAGHPKTITGISWSRGWETTRFHLLSICKPSCSLVVDRFCPEKESCLPLLACASYVVPLSCG